VRGESRPRPFRCSRIGNRRARRGGEPGGQLGGECRSGLFPGGGGQRVAGGRGGDGPLRQGVAGETGGTGLDDAVGDADEGLVGDGEREVAGAGDIGRGYPGFAGERGCDPLGGFAGVRGRALQCDAGRVLAGGTGRAQAGIDGGPQAGGGGRAGQGEPQVLGDHGAQATGLSRGSPAYAGGAPASSRTTRIISPGSNGLVR